MTPDWFTEPDTESSASVATVATVEEIHPWLRSFEFLRDEPDLYEDLEEE